MTPETLLASAKHLIPAGPGRPRGLSAKQRWGMRRQRRSSQGPLTKAYPQRSVEEAERREGRRWQAEHAKLFGRQTTNHAMLRRSISTAYYALFAALRMEAARPFSMKARTAASRLPDHGAARDVCGVLVKRGLIPWMDGTPTCNPDLLDFAKGFLVLQAERHSADYDYGYAPTKSDAQNLLHLARDGIRSLESARNDDPEQVQVMCVAMFANPAVRRRMQRR